MNHLLLYSSISMRFVLFVCLLCPPLVLSQSQPQSKRQHEQQQQQNPIIIGNNVANDTTTSTTTTPTTSLLSFSSSSTTTLRRRYLQDVDPYYIGEPDIELKTYRVILTYVLTDAIENRDIKAKIYRSRSCSQGEISGSGVIDIEIEPDDTPIGDGSGFRYVKVNVRIDPDDVAGMSIVSEVTPSRSIVSFCFQLGLFPVIDGRNRDPVNTLNTQINLVMDLNDDVEDDDGDNGYVGIVEMLDPNREEEWDVDIYRCNSTTNQRLEHPLPPISQGERFQLCIQPTNGTLNDGIRVLSIQEMDYFRGADTIQNAVIEGQQNSGDGGLTQINCESGSKYCTITSTIKNDFFRQGTGIVACSGKVNLQYGVVIGGGGRRSRNRGLLRNHHQQNNNSILRNKGNDTNNIQNIQQRQQQQRQLYFRGEYVGTKSFYLSIDVTPNSDALFAEAYRCNRFDEPLDNDNDNDNPIKFEDQGVRICVRPDLEARKRGVYMRSVDEFKFTRNDVTQNAVLSDGSESSDGRTLVICPRGFNVCSIKTDLDAAFFFEDGTIRGIGTASLQFGTDNNNNSTMIRKAQIRFLQSTATTNNNNNDPSFAGSSPISVEFNVAYSDKTKTSAFAWWETSPTSLKVLYVLALVVSTLLCCCCCFGIFFLLCKKQNKNDDDDEEEKDIFDLLQGGGTQEEEGNAMEDSADCIALDSKASFYSDLDFLTDAEDDSSDEDSITERFEDDLEQKAKIAILFPDNPDPEDLSQPTKRLSSVSDHDPKQQRKVDGGDEDMVDKPQLSMLCLGGQEQAPEPKRFSSLPSQAMPPLGLAPPPRPGQFPAPPNRHLSLPTNRLSNSDHGPQHRHSDVVTGQGMPPHGLAPGRGRGRGPGAGPDRLSSSEHGPPRNLGHLVPPPPARGRGRGRGADRLSSSEHGPPRNLPPPPPHGLNTRLSGRGKGHTADRLSISDHGPGGYVPRGGPGRGRGRARGDPGRGLSSSDHGRRGRGRGGGPGRGLSSSCHGPSRDVGGMGGMGGRAGRGRRAPPRGRAAGRNGPRHHIEGMTQVPIPGAMPPPAQQGSISTGPAPPMPRRPPPAIDVMDVIVSDDEREDIVSKPPPPADTDMAAKKKGGKSKSKGKGKKKKKKKQGGKKQTKDKAGGKGKNKKKKTSIVEDEEESLLKGSTHHTRSSTKSGGEESVESSLGSNKNKLPKPTNSDGFAEELSSTNKRRSSIHSFAGESAASSVESSIESSISSTGDDTDDDDIPDEDDVCFEAEQHPGTEAFLNAVRKTLKKLGPVAYSPKVYRSIKKKLPLRRFFVCDDDDNPYDWREVTKSELIDLVWKYYEQEKEKMQS